jgi:hypothetical protein
MPRKQDTEVPELPTEMHGRRSSVFVRFAVTVLIASVLVYLLFFFLARTAGFRAMVAERLSERLGLPVSIQAVHADWRLNLVLRGLRTTEPWQGGQPGLTLEETYVDWSVAGLLFPDRSALRRLEIEGGRLDFAPLKDGAWAPEPLNKPGAWVAERLGLELAGPAGTARTMGTTAGQGNKRKAKPAAFDRWDRVQLVLRDGDISWWSGEGREIASARGVNLRVTPLVLPSREMTHYHLTVASLDSARGLSGRQVNLELINAGDQAVILAFGMERSSAPSGEALAPEVAAPVDVTEAAEKRDVPEPVRLRAGAVIPVPVEEDDEDLAAFIRKALESAVEVESRPGTD